MAAELVSSERERFRLSWSAIFSGTFVAVGVLLLLNAIGIAVALTWLHASLSSTIWWLGVWTLVIPIIALFVGGGVAGRYSGRVTRRGAAAHGAVAWGLTELIHLFMVFVAVSALVGSVAGLAGATLNAAGSVLGGGAQALSSPQVTSAVQSELPNLLGPINQERAQRNLPPIQPQQLAPALNDAFRSAIQQGKLTPEIIQSALTRNDTGLTPPEVQRLSQQISASVQQQLAQVGGAAKAVFNTATWYSWFTALSILLSLLAATTAAQGAFGRREREAETATRRREPEPGIFHRPGEVHP